ncbi:catenin alpha-like [Macrobrachium nipponense]|uniref:catenin alpha-like n=1 Tax=Macrobrachium nipponense TaxID=159736 RepID=UPI0030C7CB8D
MNEEESPTVESQHETLLLRWDIKNIEIRTRSVEKTLEPLVMQVTTLVNSSGSSKKKKGKSKRAHVLVAAVEAATSHFIEQGKIIAKENPDVSKEMLDVVEEVKKAGEDMSSSAKEFAEDPCTSGKRKTMVLAARKLLAAVTRLLILADMVDVHRLLKRLKGVENDLENVKNASSNSELLEKFRIFNQNTEDLINQAAKRQQELKDPRLQDDLAAARAILKRNSALLLTASKAYVRHPELAAAKANRDYVLRQVCEAVNTIHDVAQGKASGLSHLPQEKAGALSVAIDVFDNSAEIDPLDYNEVTSRPTLEEQLEAIISGAALMADSYSTRDDRKQRIVHECNAVREALQDLLTEYMDNAGKREPSAALDQALGHVHVKTQDLRRQLRKAVVDHVSDSFVATDIPLLALVEAARSGDQEKVAECSKVFADYARNIVEVSNLACLMSSDEDGTKMVRYATSQIDQLYPQVINAAEMLVLRHKSMVAQENMDSFKEAWENQLRILIESVDDITTVDDFLAVSENHILEDVKACVQAISEGDLDTFERVAGAIRGRSSRVCDVVSAEMDDYEPCLYTEQVLKAVEMLRDKAIPNFGNCVDIVSTTMRDDPSKDIDENDFIDASHLVYDGVREIRLAVVMNRGDDELDPEEFVTNPLPERINIRSSMLLSTDDIQAIDEYPEVTGITTARDAMKNLSDRDKDKIAVEVENFQEEKKKLDKEVSKWDDSGNDIIALAKHISTIMMQMTDFTRGRGSLKTTMDVIEAAKKISMAGTKLDKLAREIAEKCPESSTKKDMLAYLDRIALYCHQLSITSKVKADVQSISGNLIVSALDSATSLIQAAKNLMNAVVSTVKCSYIASTKYKRHFQNEGGLRVVWRMKAPEKKPLVRPVHPEVVKAKVRKGSQKRPVPPSQVLAEIERIEEFV